jgi:trans-2,3-dihydro-3-hydroxyanthranilate isomerase
LSVKDGPMSWPDVTVVDACVRRDGRGGSPTAVTDDDAAFLGPGRTPDGGRPVRFFTATAELSGCGHGTVAAQAVRLTRTALGELNDRQHTGGRTFDTVAIRRPAGIEVWFDQGLVALRHPAPDERAAIVAALGLTADDPHPTDAPRIAAPGAPRMLVPVHDRSALLRVRPHLGRLTAACRRYGLLGCFVYVPPVGDRTGAARMFAPAIGVDEDVANANSGSGTHSVKRSVSVGQEDALAQEVGVGAAVHLSLDHFDAVDVAFDGAEL